MPEQLYPLVSNGVGVTQFRRAIDRCIVNHQDFMHVRKKLKTLSRTASIVRSSLNAGTMRLSRWSSIERLVMGKRGQFE